MPHAVVAEDQILKVHRARDGSVWYVEGARRAACSALGVHDFPDGPEVMRSSRVRLLGTGDNAPLVARFYAFKAQRKLARMRDFGWPPSLGGYHEVTPLDYASYLLATCFQFDLATPERVDQVLRGHPVWRAASFIPHLDWLRLGELMGVILDPRWYTRWDEDADEYDPRDYVNAEEKDAARLKLVLSTWKTTDAPPREALADDPRYFLWRRWRRYATAAKADLRVSQVFVDFLRRCWLDAIYMATINRGKIGRPDGLFAPDHFFLPDEAAAFRRHVAGTG
jgi:hypothetical protein